MLFKFNAECKFIPAGTHLVLNKIYPVVTDDFELYEVLPGTPERILMGTEDFYTYFSPEQKIKIPVQLLSDECKDNVYRTVWAEHVAEDAESHLSDDDRFNSLDEEVQTDVCREISHRYVFDGEYDCTQDYWSQLDALADTILPDYL